MRYGIISWLLVGCLLPSTSDGRSRKVGHARKTIFLEHEAQRILDEVYVGINAFSISEADRQLFKQHHSESTYGEILPNSLEQLVAILKPTAHDVFYDLGSGKGQAPMYMALRTDMKKCVGFELAPTRHAYAMKAKKQLDLCGKLRGCRLEFYQGDFTDRALAMGDATIVWMNSTCYPENVMLQLVQRLSTLKPGLRVVTLKKLPSAQKYNFKLIQELTLPMTWSASVNTNIYVLNKPAQKRWWSRWFSRG